VLRHSCYCSEWDMNNLYPICDYLFIFSRPIFWGVGLDVVVIAVDEGMDNISRAIESNVYKN